MVGYLNTILIGDVREQLKKLDDESIDCVVTSPPYWGLRDYGVEGQLGLEQKPQDFVENMVAVFRQVHRVLKHDGTLWLNLGDSYASFRDGKATPDTIRGDSTGTLVPKGSAANRMAASFASSSIKHKDLVGIPWRVAFALQADGWYLRQDIIWSKPNPMPESVTDRCTKSHEYIFLLTKSSRYYFDSQAIKEDSIWASDSRNGKGRHTYKGKRAENNGFIQQSFVTVNDKRNKRSVWNVATRPFKGAHFATFPQKLIEPCILAGCPKDGVVLDPFFGSGTTGLVALQHQRKYIGIELNPEYAAMAQKRLDEATGLL